MTEGERYFRLLPEQRRLYDDHMRKRDPNWEPPAVEGPVFKLNWWTHKNPSMSEALRLCHEVWNAPYEKWTDGSHASSIGNCRHKAMWLQERLGGAVVVGKIDGTLRHMALVVPIEGSLYIADGEGINTVANYAKTANFHFENFPFVELPKGAVVR